MESPDGSKFATKSYEEAVKVTTEGKYFYTPATP